jgi:hypothetical protein
MKHAPILKSSESIYGQANDIRSKLESALRVVDEFAPRAFAGAYRPMEQARLRSILRARRTRQDFFGPNLFADPAWDILLDLYAAELGQHRVSITSVCIGSGVPATTALRWIKQLECKGLVIRANDPMDGRRVFISLTRAAVEALNGFFASLPSSETVL